MEQTILDMCCSCRMFCYDKEDSRALFSDNRTEEHTLYDSPIVLDEEQYTVREPALVVPGNMEQPRKKVDRCDICSKGARGGCGTCIFNGRFE